MHKLKDNIIKKTWVAGLGWATVLGGFLLLLHIVGQGPAVLGRVNYIFIFFICLPFLMSCLFGRRLNMTEILWFRLLNPNGSYQLLPRTTSLGSG